MDTVSGTVTLAQVAIKLIKETLKFVEEVKQIDKILADLLRKLDDLKALLKEVKETCRQADSEHDRMSRPLQDALRRSDTRLEEVRQLVQNLASRPSENVLQNSLTVIRNRQSKDEVKKAIKDINDLMENIHKGISLWTLRKTSMIQERIEQRISQTGSATGANPIRSDLEGILGESVENPLQRRDTSFSTADTISEASTPSGGTSSTDVSRCSFSSASSRVRRTSSRRHDSVISRETSIKEGDEWEDFHYNVKNCGRDENLVDEVKKTLEQLMDQDPANSKDSSERSPLHMAAQRGNKKIAETLLEYRANINAKDGKGDSVLDMAVAGNHQDFVFFLIEQRVDQTLISRENSDRFNEIVQLYELSRPSPKPPTRRKTSFFRKAPKAPSSSHAPSHTVAA
ncbi:hypothetical protein EJ04DRAFT_578438 [Polyplosphaeria fusca]|uniref:Uncharacterized protein n=1 Tax=Polyplosphaeria fusca TaxID=682080 RepID=A0A9P4UXR2_9PLEO|nr:hypothetical protein EJ04DRAFT_578438 [Polyplosphaeria fusca]